MSNHQDDFDLDDDEFEDSQPMKQMRKRLRDLEKQAKQQEQLAKELDEARRENLILRTPELSTLNDRQRRALFREHEGDLTPEALIATATDLSWISQPANDVPDDEVAAHQRMQEAGVGISPQSPSNQAAAELMSASSADEFWAKAQNAGLVNGQ